jgi:hypothetical protein
VSRAEESERDDFERLRPAADEPESGWGGRAARHAEAIEEGTVDLRPRGVGEVLDLGLDLVRARFALCVGLAALFWIPIRILGMLLRPTLQAGMTEFEEIMESLSGSVAANLAVAVGTLLVAALTARIVADEIEGRESRIGSTIGLAIRRLPGLNVIGIFIYLATVAGTCLCLVPGFVVMWLLAPCPYIYILEGVNVRTAVRRSYHLTCDQLFSSRSFFSFWRWAGIVFVSGLLLSPFTTLATVADLPNVRDWVLIELALSLPAYETLSIVLGALFMGIATALQAGFLTVYYLDCRVRREGLDLEAWLGRLRPEPAASGIS